MADYEYTKEDYRKLCYALVSKISKLKTLIETIGEHKAESCTSYEIAEDLDKQSNTLDQLIIETRTLEEGLEYGGWMTAEEAAKLNSASDKVKILIGGIGSVIGDDDIEREETYDAGETVDIVCIDSCERQGLMVTIAADNGVVNTFDALDYDGYYPFKRL